MAKATKELLPVIPVPLPPADYKVILELSKFEAIAVRRLCGNVTGWSEGRQATSRVYDALSVLDGDYYDSLPSLLSRSVEFVG